MYECMCIYVLGSSPIDTFQLPTAICKDSLIFCSQHPLSIDTLYRTAATAAAATTAVAGRKHISHKTHEHWKTCKSGLRPLLQVIGFFTTVTMPKPFNMKLGKHFAYVCGGKDRGHFRLEGNTGILLGGDKKTYSSWFSICHAVG